MFILDTNILVYGWDAKNKRKQSIARGLIRRAVVGEGVVSQHLLSEFSSVLLHKMKPATPPIDVLAALDSLAAIRLAPSGFGIVRRAVEASQAYGIHFFDSLVVASAERAGCTRIYSEDLNSGQRYFGVEVVNPFA
jgi:predicted nucleic acid-binding protein